VKVLKHEASDDPSVSARFIRESHALGRLTHPNLVSVYDVGQDGRWKFIVMELVEGVSLRDWMRGAGNDPRVGLEIMRKVSIAVHHAHEQGVVHRDLKPENVLVTPAGDPKVTDFGLALLIGQSEALTRTGAVMGTIGYMAPEQASGRTDEIGPRTDVYTLGVMLYEMLTGRLPHDGATLPEACAQILSATPPRPSTLNPAISAELEAVVLRAIEKSPGRRRTSSASPDR
jgi:eukaryotic-like serine/threonine-protein kinase